MVNALRYLQVLVIIVVGMASSVPLARPDDPPDGQPAAKTRYARSLRLVLTFTGPGGAPTVTKTGFIFNRRGELMPATREEYVRTEDALYRIGKEGTQYVRATGPVEGPTCEANCGGITLWRLCTEGVIASKTPAPLMNVSADSWEEILAKFATKLGQLDDRKPNDVIYWPSNPDNSQGKHVTYVEEARGNDVTVLATKDRAESLMWRRGPLIRVEGDPLYNRYGDPVAYRLKPGVSLTWRYWRDDPTAKGLPGQWRVDGQLDQVYKIEPAPNHETEYPIVITDAAKGTSARAAFDGAGIMYRTEWGDGPNDPMKYQARIEPGQMLWTNLIERDPETNQPLPFRPETWRTVVEGKLTFTGTWMYRYLVAAGKEEVRRATDGTLYHPNTGEMMPFRVLKNDASFTVDLATGKLSGTMAFEYRYGSSDKPAQHSRRVDVDKIRVDPVAFSQERGLFYLVPIEGASILFSREARFQPAGWPALGDTFAVYGLSRTQLNALRDGKPTSLPEYFCVLSTSGEIPSSTVDPGASGQIKSSLAKGEPVVTCTAVVRGHAGGLEATVVDGATRIKETLTARRLLPTGSRIETNADSVVLRVMEESPDTTGGVELSRVVLKPGSRFDTGAFVATHGALEVLLRAGGARVTEGHQRAIRNIAIKMVTPTATIYRDGTDYIVEVDGETGDTIVKVIEGSVRVVPKNPTLQPFVLKAGRQASLTIATQAPAQPYKATPGELEPFIEPAEGPGQKPIATQPAVGAQKTPSRIGPNMPKSSGPVETVNTLVHHQLTNEDGIRADCFPALSASGSHIVYAEGGRPVRTWIMGFDGGGRRQVMETTDCPTDLGVSDDGSTVMLHLLREVHVVTGGSPRKLAWTSDPEITAARLSGDGSTVCFILGRDAPLNGAPKASPAGVYRVGSGGGAPKLIAGQEAIRAALGLLSNEGAAFEQSLAVSRDGSRFAFGAVAYSAANAGPKIMAVSASGGSVRMIAEGTRDQRGHAGWLAFSNDAGRVAYKIGSWGGTAVAAVAPFAGGQPVILSTSEGPLRYPGDLVDPITFSGDGLWVLLGSTGVMVTTDGKQTHYSVSAARGAGNSVLLANRFLRGVMDASARRFVYVCGDERNAAESRQRSQIATAEIGPKTYPGAPQIASVAITPTTLIPEKNGLTVRARVSSQHALVLVAKTALLGGLHDGELSSEVLFDDGQRSGDEKGGDGIFTTNRLFGSPTATPGPRVIRVDAECREANGRRHASVVEVGPIQVRKP